MSVAWLTCQLFASSWSHVHWWVASQWPFGFSAGVNSSNGKTNEPARRVTSSAGSGMLSSSRSAQATAFGPARLSSIPGPNQSSLTAGSR